jgi:hypothetical protein
MRREPANNSPVGRYRFPLSYVAAASLLTLEQEYRARWEEPAHQAAEGMARALLARDSMLVRGCAMDLTWPTDRTPRVHQKRALAALHAVNYRQLVTDEMGVGKSPLALWAFWDVYNRHATGPHSKWAQRMLILCPAPVKRKWVREVTATLGMTAVMIDGPAKKRGDQFVELRDATVCVMNYDLLRFLSEAQREQLHQWVYDQFAVYDESHYLRNHYSGRSKFVAEFKPRYLLELTGTPIENQVDDLYHQLILLQPGLWRNEWEFESRYLETFMLKVGGGKKKATKKKIARTKNLDELSRVQTCYSFGRKLCDVTDLPPVQEIEIPLVLDAPARKFYKQLRDWWLLEFEDTPDDNVFSPRVKSSLEAAQRLLQVAESFIGGVPEPLLPMVAQQSKYWEKIPHRPNELFAPKGVKASWLMETVENLWKQDRRSVVFCPYNAPLFWFKDHWGDDARLLHGALSSAAKDEIIDTFLQGSGRVLLAQLRMAIGWDAYTVQDCIFYGWMWEPAKNRQAVGRLHRIGQKGTVNVYHPFVVDTLEERVREALAAKEGDAEKALAHWSFADLREAVSST